VELGLDEHRPGQRIAGTVGVEAVRRLEGDQRIVGARSELTGRIRGREARSPEAPLQIGDVGARRAGAEGK
jgi:hypothetical protein